MKTLSLKRSVIGTRTDGTKTAKTGYLALVGTLACLHLAACNQTGDSANASEESGGDVQLTSLDQRFSYVFGMNIGQQMKQMQSQEIDVDIEVFVQGLRDVHSGGEPKLSDEQVQATIQEFQQQQQEKQMAMQAEQQAEMEAVGTANKQAGEEFLAANAEKEGVVVLPSGLQYKVIEEGSGPKPAAEDEVTVHYRGRLLDGTEFDSSYSRNAPATFSLNRVIPGWTEGVQLMSEGAKYEFYIPPDLAYGPSGSGPTIGPHATLIFEVELLKAKAEEN